MKRMAVSLLMLLGASAGGAPPGISSAASPADPVAGLRSSGLIVKVDAGKHLLVFEELGPGIRGSGKNLVHRVEITVTSATRLVRVDRGSKGGKEDDWVESAVDFSELRTGQFVTVEGHRAARGVQADKISVIGEGRRG